MVSGARRFCLALKAACSIQTLSEGAGQYFERNLALESGVFGQEDFSHAAPAEQADDLVWPDAASDGRLIEILRGRPRGFRKDRRVNETPFPLVRSDQSPDLFTQLL